jgi:hypothetical protein
LEEQHRRERAVALTLEKEEAARTLVRQLLATQKVVAPEADVTVSSPDDDTSSRDVTVVAHLHAQAAMVHDVWSLVTIVLNPLSTKYSWWLDMMLLALCLYTLDDHILTDKIDDTTYWYHYVRIVLTCILDTLFVNLHEIICEPSETAW